MVLIKGNVERIAESQAAIAKLKADGFVPLTGETVCEKEDTKILEEMTVSELKTLAKEKGLEGFSGLTKEQLLSVLKDVV